MFAFVDGWVMSVEIFHLEETSRTPSIQISVDHAEVMHILQPIRNAG